MSDPTERRPRPLGPARGAPAALSRGARTGSTRSPMDKTTTPCVSNARAITALTELMSELQWLERSMDRAGLRVPKPPRPPRVASFWKTSAAMYVDMVTWLDGTPIGQTRASRWTSRMRWGPSRPSAPKWRGFTSLAMPGRDRRALFAAQWDTDGLLGEAPRWGRFWDNPTLDAETRRLLIDFRTQRAARSRRARSGHGPDPCRSRAGECPAGRRYVCA